MIQQNKLSTYLRESRDVIPTPFNKTGKLSFLCVFFSPCWMYILSCNWALIQATNFYLTEKSSFRLKKVFFFKSMTFLFGYIYQAHNRISVLLQDFRWGIFLVWDIIAYNLNKWKSHLKEPYKVRGRITVQWVSSSLLSSVRKLKLFSWLFQKGISLILMRTSDPIKLFLISPIKHIIYFFSLFTELTC